ncbi:hypothetical protein ACOTJB_23530 [Achromobacter xylosoxidans]
MAPVTLEGIRLIVEQATQHSPLAYALLFVAVAGPAFTAYVGAYFRKRADTSAIQDDLDIIKDQLRQTTQVAEQVKAAIGFQDWHQRESLSLRRQKLEELAELAAVSHRQMRDWWAATVAGVVGVQEAPHTTMDRLTVLSSLYFPNLDRPTSAYVLQLLKISSQAQKLLTQLIGGTTAQDREAVKREATAQLNVEFPVLSKLHESLQSELIGEMQSMLAATP